MLDYIIEIPSVNSFPIKLNMCDSIGCPICETNLSEELNINLETFEIDENTILHCNNCDSIIKFRIKMI
jgi:hypothetical protein